MAKKYWGSKTQIYNLVEIKFLFIFKKQQTVVDGDMIKLKVKVRSFQNNGLAIRIILASQTIGVLRVNLKSQWSLNCLNIDETFS